MKKILATTAVLAGLVSDLSAQGYFLLDNTDITNRVSIDTAGNPYNGTYGMEVWMSSNSDASLSAALDMTAATNSLAAYALLAAYGFQLQQTFVSQTMIGGVFQLGIFRAPVCPPGSPVTLALAAWNNAAGNWTTAGSDNAKEGLIAFVQPTVDYTFQPPQPPPLNWTVPQDLVMLSSVPEPAAWLLGLAGGAVILMLRRRKMPWMTRVEHEIDPDIPAD